MVETTRFELATSPAHLAMIVGAEISVIGDPFTVIGNVTVNVPVLAGAMEPEIVVEVDPVFVKTPSVATIVGTTFVKSGPPFCHVIMTPVDPTAEMVAAPADGVTTATGCITLIGKVTVLPSFLIRLTVSGEGGLLSKRTEISKDESVMLFVEVTPDGGELSDAPVRPELCRLMVEDTPSNAGRFATPATGGVLEVGAVTLMRAEKVGNKFPTTVIAPN